jgi:hypothetical protein
MKWHCCNCRRFLFSPCDGIVGVHISLQVEIGFIYPKNRFSRIQHVVQEPVGKIHSHSQVYGLQVLLHLEMIRPQLEFVSQNAVHGGSRNTGCLGHSCCRSQTVITRRGHILKCISDNFHTFIFQGLSPPNQKDRCAIQSSFWNLLTRRVTVVAEKGSL